jgi:hypothetical protein
MRTELRSFGLAACAALALLAAGSGAIMAQPIMTQPTPSPVPIQPQPIQRVTLSAVPLQSTFALGQAVTLNLTLKNTGPSALGLSNLLAGNLHITAATRNGIAVRPRATSTSYEEDLAAALGTSLSPVAPNGTLAVAWKSENDKVGGGQALTAVAFAADADHQTLFFNLDSPGTYQVSFYYQYPGPTAGFAGTVFTAKTNTVTVSFNVF